jgi:hypothetical protein
MTANDWTKPGPTWIHRGWTWIAALGLACSPIGLGGTVSTAARGGLCGGANIGGTVFSDYNSNGRRDVGELGVGGVPVSAYDAAGSLVDSASSGTNGSYVLDVPAGTGVRLEFTALPSGYFEGFAGQDSRGSVTFLQSPDCGRDFAVLRPHEHCQDEPDLATNCYVSGNQMNPDGDVLISFPYSAGGNQVPEVDQPAHVSEAVASQIGPTWGLAYHRASDSIFAAAFMKRHSAFGPGGTGAIYRIDRSAGRGGPVSVFLDLDDLFGAGTAGADPHPQGTNFQIDPNSWDPVGKVALGDLDLSEDEQTLWTINLADRRLYRIPIGSPPVPPQDPNEVDRFVIPLDQGDCPNPASDLRPFGIGIHEGNVYVGAVCTAQSQPQASPPPATSSQLRAYVYRLEPARGTFTLVLSFPLGYTRGCAVRQGLGQTAGCASANWRHWTDDFTVFTTPFSAQDGSGEVISPQPWFNDIEFDNGDMILGLRDRSADQLGLGQRSTDPNDARFYSGDSAGDLLRACQTAPGTWALESGGNCPPPRSGPDGDEYYFGEEHPFHEENSHGSLLQLAGRPEVVVTAYDPVFDTEQAFDGGILWMDNAAGFRIRSYRVFPGTQPFFGKAGGLGDLVALCRPAPLQIGTRVWNDADADGIQDGGEAGLSGVEVRLFLAADANSPLAVAFTDGLGEAFFDDSNVPGGIRSGTAYLLQVRNDVSPLSGAALSPADQGGNDLIDSDGMIGLGGFPEKQLTTGASGQSDHSVDFGFNGAITPLPSPTPTATPTPSPTPAGCQDERLLNGGFESFSTPTPPNPGDPFNWAQGPPEIPDRPICRVADCSPGANEGPRSGNGWAWLGRGRPGTNPATLNLIQQIVSIPPGIGRLSFWLRVSQVDTDPGISDFLRVTLGGTNNIVFERTESAGITGARGDGGSGYVQITAELGAFSSGRAQELLFTHVAFGPGVFNVNIDDVSVCADRQAPPISLSTEVSRVEVLAGLLLVLLVLAWLRPWRQQRRRTSGP